MNTKIKIAVGVSLSVFLVLTTAIISAGLILYQNNKLPASLQNSLSNFNGSNTNPQVVLTAEEVAKHNIPEDCWLIISNNVYDVSKYLVTHPGGKQTITPYCGKDVSAAFGSKDKSKSQDHSSFAKDLLKNYFLGTIGKPLESNISPTNPSAAGQTNNPNQPANNTPKTTTVTLTAAEVAKHNTSTDCWMIVSGKVYDVGSYIRSHPGGFP